jgi:hypothetical protein
MEREEGRQEKRNCGIKQGKNVRLDGTEQGQRKQGI